MANGLRGTELLCEHGYTYDVICRVIRHILNRWEKRFPELLALIRHTKMLLPSMHIHAHQELCQLDTNAVDRAVAQDRNRSVTFIKTGLDLQQEL